GIGFGAVWKLGSVAAGERTYNHSLSFFVHNILSLTEPEMGTKKQAPAIREQQTSRTNQLRALTPDPLDYRR
ncbi:MAG: hypothetical protein ABJM18_03860, partial [Hyphomonas sp.]|uniref:hypothetical protein n=1 Tax=Hyphomonas sp. TaxID=87 RepID=UPI00329921E2